MSTKGTIHSVEIKTDDIQADIHVYHETLDPGPNIYLTFTEHTGISTSMCNVVIHKDLWAKLVEEIREQ